MKPIFRIIVVPELKATGTFMNDWFDDREGRHGWINLFENGIVMYKLIGWK